MKRSERGFTLIEILVALAIVALIGGAASMATSQVITGTKRSNDHMTAIRQVQNAGYWISNDTLMAQSIVPDNDPETPEFITLYWTDWVDDEEHKVVYTFHDMAGGLKRLKRQYLIDGEETTTFVAEYIDSGNSVFAFSEENGVWKLYIEATSGAVTETREYEIDPRVNM